MKLRLLANVLVLAALMSLSTAAASAQSEGSLVARIPFSFSVQQEKFSAGNYVVEPLQHGYIRLRGANQSVLLHVQPNYSGRQSGPKGTLIFARYGSEYFLKQAWIPSADFGMNFTASQRETRLAEIDREQSLIAVSGH